ncbi:nucleotide-binding universal stress UspA family protein [Rhodococcus sp. PvR099]|nr:universal stress protein [Rhodococcus sp. PvR099]MBP1158848.1 nucleotide-binding universal stress UspA family protein [Rhodococcus sp. PvR099]
MDAVELNAPVVVGIDGSTGAYAAVSWAAREAQLHGCALHIVSALGDSSPYGDGIRPPPSYFADRDRAVHAHLDEAAAIARTTRTATSTTEITTSVLDGPARPALLEASKSARMVVVGSRGLGQITAALAGSVAVALAAHAHSPVVIIRGHSGQTSGTGDVVVGVDGTENSLPALETAFEEASLRATGLDAVHTWSPFTLSRAFDDQLDLPWDEVEAAEQAALAESLAGLVRALPGDLGDADRRAREIGRGTAGPGGRRGTAGGRQPRPGRLRGHADRLDQHSAAAHRGLPAHDRPVVSEEGRRLPMTSPRHSGPWSLSRAGPNEV